MSMTEVIESIEKDMWRELESRRVPEEQPEMVDCTTLEYEPEVDPKKICTDILNDFPSTNWTLEGMIGGNHGKV